MEGGGAPVGCDVVREVENFKNFKFFEKSQKCEKCIENVLSMCFKVFWVSGRCDLGILGCVSPVNWQWEERRMVGRGHRKSQNF